MTSPFGVSGTFACTLKDICQPCKWRIQVPTISQFFGIVIQMFWREHAPPHFHALYGEFEALIEFVRWKYSMASSLDELWH
jgi:hypothetical protein